LSGHSKRPMARSVGLDRNTVRRYIQVAEQCGLLVADGVDALFSTIEFLLYDIAY